MAEPGAPTHTFEEEVDSSGKTGQGKRKSRENHDDQEVALGVEGGGVGDEVVRKRPRGRPAGSRNKPKPSPSITMMGNENPHALSAHVLQISYGCDVAESLMTYARRRQQSICVLSASGTVSNITLRHPASPGTIMSLQGYFEILSLSGSFLLPPAPPAASVLTVTLSDGHGQVVGGRVVGALMSSGPIVIVAASFRDATYDHLPLHDEESQPIHLISQSTTLNSPPQHRDSSSVPPIFLTTGMPLNCDGASISWASTRPPPS